MIIYFLMFILYANMGVHSRSQTDNVTMCLGKVVESNFTPISDW